MSPSIGFSDPVYAEAVVTVSGFDIILGMGRLVPNGQILNVIPDLLIINQTTTTLQNLTVEFSTLGDLKLVSRASSPSIGTLMMTWLFQVERPIPHTLAPHAFHHINATVKVV